MAKTCKSKITGKKVSCARQQAALKAARTRRANSTKPRGTRRRVTGAGSTYGVFAPNGQLVDQVFQRGSGHWVTGDGSVHRTQKLAVASVKRAHGLRAVTVSIAEDCGCS